MTTDIRQLLDEWTESERTGNGEALGTMLTDDFVGIGPVGFTLPKQVWVSRFSQGLHYDDLALDDVAVHRYGDTAVVVAHQHAVGSHNGNPTPEDTRVSFTIVPDDGDMRIAAIQYSFLAAPPGQAPGAATGDRKAP
jgi:ketosteroid isomerase-like protein